MATQFAIPASQSANRHAGCNDLVETHMGLVRKIAWQVRSRISSAIDLDDLIQTGMVALVEAARSYEDRGHAFATYATLRIRGSMVDGLRRQSAQCRSAMGKRRAIEAARARFEGLAGRAPTDAELALAMEVSEGTLRSDLRAAAPVRHEPIDTAYSDHMIEFADEREPQDAAFDRQQLQDAIADAIRMLPEREGVVLQLYFVDEKPLEEIGAVLGVGAARVCQIKKAALEKVRLMLGDRV